MKSNEPDGKGPLINGKLHMPCKCCVDMAGFLKKPMARYLVDLCAVFSRKRHHNRYLAFDVCHSTIERPMSVLVVNDEAREVAMKALSAYYGREPVDAVNHTF